MDVTPRLLFPQEEALVSPIQEAEWARGQVWTGEVKITAPVSTGGSNPAASNSQQVALPTTLSRSLEWMKKLENCHQAARYHIRCTVIFTGIAVRKSNVRSQYSAATCLENVPTAVENTVPQIRYYVQVSLRGGLWLTPDYKCFPLDLNIVYSLQTGHHLTRTFKRHNNNFGQIPGIQEKLDTTCK